MLKCREGGRICNLACVIATGPGADGHWEIRADAGVPGAVRYPLRCAVRSGVRSCRPAPIWAETSASMIAWASTLTPFRSTST